MSVPAFALDAWMAARSVQTPVAVAHTLLVGLELARSAVLFTMKVCTAPHAGTPPMSQAAAMRGAPSLDANWILCLVMMRGTGSAWIAPPVDREQ